MTFQLQLNFSKIYPDTRLMVINSSTPDHHEIEDSLDGMLLGSLRVPHFPDHNVALKIEAEICTLSELYQISDSRKYVVPAKHAMKALDCLSALAAEYADFIYIGKNDFIALLGNLVESGHLTPEKADHYRKTTPVVYTIKDMEADAKIKRDADLALKLAQSYKEDGCTTDQLYWLNQAKHFDSAHPFFAVPDNLRASLDGIEKADMRFLFDEGDAGNWLLDPIAACPTFKHLCFGNNFHPKWINETFADFIKKSQYVSILDLGVGEPTRVKMTPEHAKVLARALRGNCSVEALLLCEQNIGDEGLKAIIDALIQNPEARLKNLNVFACDITGWGARYLLDNIEKIPSLRTVNLKYNDACPQVIRDNIEAVLNKRVLMESPAGGAHLIPDTSAGSYVTEMGLFSSSANRAAAAVSEDIERPVYA